MPVMQMRPFSAPSAFLPVDGHYADCPLSERDACSMYFYGSVFMARGGKFTWDWGSGLEVRDAVLRMVWENSGGSFTSWKHTFE